MYCKFFCPFFTVSSFSLVNSQISEGASKFIISSPVSLASNIIAVAFSVNAVSSSILEGITAGGGEGDPRDVEILAPLPGGV